MPTSETEAFRDRRAAESFGVDAPRYDRTRPSYPGELIARLAAPQVLDVGIGTGIVARQLRAAGSHVTGVEPDPRMAAFTRDGGFEVEVATFEQWDPRGRTFDAVVAGQTWHWVDPVAGAAKAASVLRPGGRLALFWNAGQPSPAATAAFADIYERLMPGSRLAAAYRGSAGNGTTPAARATGRPDPAVPSPKVAGTHVAGGQVTSGPVPAGRVAGGPVPAGQVAGGWVSAGPVTAAQGYAVFLDKADEASRATGAFAGFERWSYEWERVYTRDEWLDQLPAQGLLTTLPPAELAALSSATSAAIDALGGSFTMRFTTLATTATRVSR